MSLKFSEIKLNKKEFHRLKQPICLNQVEISKIVISNELKLDNGVKNFIGYKNGETVKPLCIILPQMSGFIKYFENNKKTMSFLADDEDVILKYNKLGKYIKTRLKTFEDKVITKFKNNEIPKENNHYCCNLC